MKQLLLKLAAMNKTPAIIFATILNKYGFYMFNRWMRNQGYRIEYVLYIHKVAAQQKSLDKLMSSQ